MPTATIAPAKAEAMMAWRGLAPPRAAFRIKQAGRNNPNIAKANREKAAIANPHTNRDTLNMAFLFLTRLIVDATTNNNPQYARASVYMPFKRNTA